MREDGRLQACDLRDALTRVWPTDAHFAAYEPIELPVAGTDRTAIVRPRITADQTSPDTIYDCDVPMRMVALVGDLDDPVAHETGGDARDEWVADIASRLESSGLAWYRTARGARCIMRLAVPFEIRTPADTQAWRELYMSWRQWAAEAHGLEIDRACADPTRVFRLPCVTRDGELNEADVVRLDQMPVFDPGVHLRDVPDTEETNADARVVDGDRGVLPAPDDTPAPTERAKRLAKAIGLRWLDGGRIETNAALNLFGGLLGHHWSKAEVASLLALLDAHEPDERKRAEHRRILGNAVALDGFGGFVDWAGEDWADADAALNYDPAIDRLRERSARLDAAPSFDAARVNDLTPDADAFTAMCDWADRTRPPPALEYVVPGLELAPGKVSAIQAFARGGKTPFALLLALCVASGKPFVGHDVVQCPALYLAFEGGLLTEEREARLCAGLGLDRAAVPFRLARPHGYLDPGFCLALEDYVRAHRIGLVVVDTYTSGVPGDIDHNSSRFSEAMRALGDLSDATGACVVVLLHENKGDRQDSMRGISGHNTVPAAIQAAIRLRNDPERSTLTVSCTREVRRPFETFDVMFRDVDDPSAPTGSALVAERVAIPTPAQASAMRGESTARSCNAAKQHDRRRRLLHSGERIMTHAQSQAAVNRHHSASVLMRVVGDLGRNVAAEALARLVEAGLLRADPGGGYSLTEAGVAADAAAVTAALIGPPEALGARFARGP